MNPLRFHHEQGFSNSCVAACITIVRLRLGTLERSNAADHETELCERLGATRGGIFIDVAAAELGSPVIPADPDSPTSLLKVREDLASGTWWHIAIMGSGELAQHHERLGQVAMARHGALSDPGPPHAVVLVGIDGSSILYLDPWLPEQAQPQRMGAAAFAQAWTGMFIPVRLA